MVPTEGPAQAKSTEEEKTRVVCCNKGITTILHLPVIKCFYKDFQIIKSLYRQHESLQKSVKPTAASSALCSCADKADFDIPTTAPPESEREL